MNIDHVVLWVSNQKRSLDFFVNVVGLEPVRAREFLEGSAGFPSVRVSEMTIIDLMDKSKAASVRTFTGGRDGAGGTLVNHVCLSMGEAEYAALATRLAEHGQEPKDGGSSAFGARGPAEASAYFHTPTAPSTSNGGSASGRYDTIRARNHCDSRGFREPGPRKVRAA